MQHVLVTDDNFDRFTSLLREYLECDFKVVPGTVVYLNGHYMVIVEGDPA